MIFPVYCPRCHGRKDGHLRIGDRACECSVVVKAPKAPTDPEWNAHDDAADATNYMTGSVYGRSPLSRPRVEGVDYILPRCAHCKRSIRDCRGDDMCPTRAKQFRR